MQNERSTKQLSALYIHIWSIGINQVCSSLGNLSTVCHMARQHASTPVCVDRVHRHVTINHRGAGANFFNTITEPRHQNTRRVRERAWSREFD